MGVGCHANIISYFHAKESIFLEIFKENLLQLSHNMFCKNIARLAVARGRNYV